MKDIAHLTLKTCMSTKLIIHHIATFTGIINPIQPAGYLLYQNNGHALQLRDILGCKKKQTCLANFTDCFLIQWLYIVF
jgi:hypothetical protein